MIVLVDVYLRIPVRTQLPVKTWLMVSPVIVPVAFKVTSVNKVIMSKIIKWFPIPKPLSHLYIILSCGFQGDLCQRGKTFLSNKMIHYKTNHCHIFMFYYHGLHVEVDKKCQCDVEMFSGKEVALLVCQSLRHSVSFCVTDPNLPV